MEGGKHGFTVLSPAFVDILLTDETILHIMKVPVDGEAENAKKTLQRNRIRTFLSHASETGLCVLIADQDTLG